MFLASVEFNYHSFNGNCQFACNKSITCPVGKLWYIPPSLSGTATYLLEGSAHYAGISLGIIGIPKRDNYARIIG